MRISNYTNKMNATIDVAKLLMAILVVGIHTEPFGFNIWLDRGFGIITRLCVPFFFIASSYFFWKSEKPLGKYILRLGIIYIVWSLIYLPFDFPALKNSSFGVVALRYFWHGNEHSLWYLCGSIIGMLLTYVFYVVFNNRPEPVFFISVILLFVGCLLSTYAPVSYKILSVQEYTGFNTRNGLFYAFPYIALGLMIAKNKSAEKTISNTKLIVGVIISLFLLVAESIVFVIVFNTNATILWMSVLPCSYFLFLFVKNGKILLPQKTTIFIRKLSTLVYLCHGLFLLLFDKLETIPYFIAVTLCSLILASIIIIISRNKYFRWLQLLY